MVSSHSCEQHEASTNRSMESAFLGPPKGSYRASTWSTGWNGFPTGPCYGLPLILVRSVLWARGIERLCMESLNSGPMYIPIDKSRTVTRVSR